MTPTSYMTPSTIAAEGFRALVEKLGPGGAIEFVHQYEKGEGDYTKERAAILQGCTIDGFMASRQRTRKVNAPRKQRV